MPLDLIETAGQPEFSAIVAVSEIPHLSSMLESYRAGLDSLNLKYELICITDGRETETMAALQTLAADWPELAVLGQRPWSGDDAALQVAVQRVRAELILTLPGWPEIDPAGLPDLFEALGGSDMVIAARAGRSLSGWGRLRRNLFHQMLKGLFGLQVADPFCRVRLGRKPVLQDSCGLGVRQHFIPSIAAQRGYKIEEAQLPPASREETEHMRFVFKPLGHMRAVLDALMLYVVLKFLRRPMRFFGAIGLPVLLFGLFSTAILVGYRLFGDAALADRPVLIFAVLMVVLGIQIIGLGLVGEIIIFSQSRRMKQYTVRSIQKQDAEAISRKTQEVSATSHHAGT
ncbi:glycosyl transferase family 2 (plasmid) [Leisingera sp. NJS201]|uniref:glycosyl transferase family 2 n=1 Tax=Leisingera sp. NJS201 TaxID=2508306 RepID=UPI00107104E6|nr:glycosyl transferase family 2 [Leisingera sp. NJS201]QBR38595.1 glycosyl transferase family 2 [Leisingera sp. NJS201]